MLNSRSIKLLLQLKEAGYVDEASAGDVHQIMATIGRDSRADVKRCLRHLSDEGHLGVVKKEWGKPRWYVSKPPERSQAPERMPRDHAKRAFTLKTPGVKRGHWKYEEDETLRLSWGEEHIATLSFRLKRTPAAIRKRVYLLGLGAEDGSGRHGLLSTNRIASESGYTARKIRAAARNIGINPTVLPRTDPYSLDPQAENARAGYDPDDVEKILDYLKSIPDGKQVVDAQNGRDRAWGKGKPTACVRHGGTNIQHHANGLCKSCYVWWRRNGKPDLSQMASVF